MIVRIASYATKVSNQQYMDEPGIVDRIQAKHMEILSEENRDIQNPQFEMEVIQDEYSEGWACIITRLVVPKQIQRFQFKDVNIPSDDRVLMKKHYTSGDYL